MSNKATSQVFFGSSNPPRAPTLFFFALVFFFPLLRSLFFSPDMPNLQISAYLMKNPSNASGSTIVDNLILCSLLSLDFPFVARIIIGRRFGREWSLNWSPATGTESESGISPKLTILMSESISAEIQRVVKFYSIFVSRRQIHGRSSVALRKAARVAGRTACGISGYFLVTGTHILTSSLLACALDISAVRGIRGLLRGCCLVKLEIARVGLAYDPTAPTSTFRQ